MREILFRGKRLDNGEWVEGSLVYDSAQNKAYITERFEDKAAYISEVATETIGQYTGIKDKNGTKKIFEGDIITASVFEREYGDEYLSGVPIKVCFCGGYFYPFHITGGWRSSVEDIEIIGNIHDHPELIGGEQCTLGKS